MLEEKNKPGAVAVGTRTMQEGGALGPWSREQVCMCACLYVCMYVCMYVGSHDAPLRSPSHYVED